MSSEYLNGLVKQQVTVLRTKGAEGIDGILKKVEDGGIVVAYEAQEMVPSGEPMSTGCMIEEEVYIPFETIDRVVRA